MSNTTKKTTNKTSKTKKPVAKTHKPNVERDRFGSRPTTESGQINAAMTTKPQTVAAIATKTGLSTSRVRNHMRWLMEREHVTKTEDGYKVAK